MIRCALILAAMGLAGCSLLPARGRIKLPEVTVQAPKDAGTPGTAHTAKAGTSVPLPAGSVVTVTEQAAQPAQPATASTPAVPAQPASKITVITPAAASEYRHDESTVTASTGTIDTTVAKHRIEVEERRPLLYAAIAAAIAGLGFMYVRFQAIAGMCFLGAGCFFAAWRMAEISPWVGGIFLVAAVAGYAFYKRAEWDRDGDGIPDRLQSKIKNQKSKISAS